MFTRDDWKKIAIAALVPTVISAAGFFFTLWSTQRQNADALKSLSETVSKLDARINGIDQGGTSFGRMQLIELKAKDAALTEAVADLRADNKQTQAMLKQLSVDVGVLLDRTKPNHP